MARVIKLIISCAFMAALTASQIAAAEPVIDYVPLSAQLDYGLADDVSGHRHWVLTISIKNQGNVPGQPRTMRVRVNNNTFTASVYGGAASGHALYGKINAGETGLLRIPLGSDRYDFVQALSKCQVNARIHIDFDRAKQVHYLDYIWANDIKTLPLKDALWVRRCVIRGPVGRPIPPIVTR